MSSFFAEHASGSSPEALTQLRYGVGSSFMDLIAAEGGVSSRIAQQAQSQQLDIVHGTTIVALTYPGGVVMAGDRRATMGNIIAQRDIRKVFPADDYSCVGIAGAAGLAVEMVRLFQVELEHYEKIEGALMSLEGKANRLAHMVRANLPMAMQGLAVVPLFVGYDLRRDCGRIFSYDVTGGRYEEHLHHAVGSGSLFARGSLKKLYQHSQDRHEAIRTALEALWDAADDDSATGGPDMQRKIWPVVATVSADGYQEVPVEELQQITEAIVADRTRGYHPPVDSGGDLR